MITVDSVSFEYPTGVRALNNVSLSIAEGERLALVGQNGAGKSTLSRLLNGLLKPTSGDVAIDGISTADKRADEIAAHVAYVFQNPDDQIFSKSIWEECSYALDKRGVEEDELTRRVREALDICDVKGIDEENPLDQPLAVRKFITTAAALALKPRYLILDEPTAGLDAAGRRTLLHVMEWAQQQGMAVVAVSHDTRFVIESFPRVVVMAHGQVIGDGTPDDCFSHDEVLTEAALDVPPTVSLARRAGADKSTLTHEQILKFLASQDRPKN